MCYYLPPRSCQLVRREHTALDSLDHSLLRIPAPKAIRCPISPLLNPRPCQTSQTKGWARQLNFPMWAARQLLWLEHLSVSIYLHWSSDFQLDLSEQRNNLGGRKVPLLRFCPWKWHLNRSRAGLAQAGWLVSQPFCGSPSCRDMLRRAEAGRATVAGNEGSKTSWVNPSSGPLFLSMFTVRSMVNFSFLAILPCG